MAILRRGDTLRSGATMFRGSPGATCPWSPSSGPNAVDAAPRAAPPLPQPSAAWPSLGLNIPFVEGSMDGATPRWADILAMGVAAEDAGFDAVWISDHVGFGDPAGEWHGAWESWTLLSALASATTLVRLGT